MLSPEVEFAPFKILRNEGGQEYGLFKAGFQREKIGLPGLPGNFTSDTVISGMLAEYPSMLKDQLRYCAYHQGRSINSYTACEPGKIHHEEPGVQLRGVSTEYVSSYSTAMYLLGHDVYERLTGDRSLVNEQKENIEEAVKYVLRHLDDDVFWEDHSYTNAKNFALRTTIWNDSGLPDRITGEPDYRVMFPLLQAQNIRGLRSAARLLEREDLNEQAQRMVSVLHPQYFDAELGTFYIGYDRKGPIRGICIDSLLMLFYLEKGDISEGCVESIINASAVLETSAGYLTWDPRISRASVDDPDSDYYDKAMLAPFVQAMVDIGAKRFGKIEPQRVAKRVIPYLSGSNPELLIVTEDGGIVKDGVEEQLWTAAAKIYFAANSHEPG